MASSKKKLEFRLYGFIAQVRTLRNAAKSDHERAGFDYISEELFKIADWVDTSFPEGTKRGAAKQQKAKAQAQAAPAIDAKPKPADNPVEFSQEQIAGNIF